MCICIRVASLPLNFTIQDLMANITALGVGVTEATGHGLGAVTAILVNADGSLSAAGDPRRGGSAMVSNGTVYP
jgi:gamma-glutamyltranspeptidase